ncbi:hypothetical protein HY797_01260 [Candidatus Falkowbacteria bacterium]|nr:hypothetical protein [Candidatus Falkowbacteria bacterium]
MSDNDRNIILEKLRGKSGGVAIAELFGYISSAKLFEIIEKMKEEGLVEVKNSNRVKMKNAS